MAADREADHAQQKKSVHVVVMMPVRSQQLVSRLLLLIRQAVVKRTERGQETARLLYLERGKAAARLEALYRVLRRAGGLVARLGKGGVHLLGVVAHPLGELVPLRLLLRRNAELGLEKGDAAFDVPAGAPMRPIGP